MKGPGLDKARCALMRILYYGDGSSWADRSLHMTVMDVLPYPLPSWTCWWSLAVTCRFLNVPASIRLYAPSLYADWPCAWPQRGDEA
jgi:hypothetical protein